MTADRSRVEEAKALRAIKGVTSSDKEFEAVVKTLFSKPDPARDRALEGLSQEDEFAILCRLMGTGTNLTRLDQSPLLEQEERPVPPDFLASFAPGCSVLALPRIKVNLTYSCFVEVKSEPSSKFRISERDLTRREAFAHHFNLPLVFAVRFRKYGGAMWLLVTTRQLRKLGRTFNPSKLTDGVGHALLDDYFLAAPNDFDFAYTWDKEAPKSYVHDEAHGALVGMDLYEKGEPHAVGKPVIPILMAILEAFGPTVISTNRAERKTVQILRVPANQGRLLSFIVYNCNQLPTDLESGKRAYDAVRITSSFDADKPHMSLLTREIVEYFIEHFFLGRTLFKVSLGDPDDQMALLKKLSAAPLKT